MLFAFSAVFTIFAIILITRRGLHMSTFFLIGIVMSWTMAILFLNIYLNTLNYYYTSIQQLFGLPKSIWLFIHYLGIGSEFSLRMLSLAAMLFVYFLLCFALSYVSTSDSPRQKRAYISLALPVIIIWLYYDNGFYIWLHKNYRPLISSASFIDLEALIMRVSKSIQYGYLILAFIILTRYLFSYPKIRFLRNRTLSTILCLIPITAIYIMMFSWLPRRMVKPMLLPGYYNYLKPQLAQFIIFYNWIPYLVFLAMAVLVYTIYKYNTVEYYHKSMDTNINRSIDVATLGIKAFTHSVKNHAIAIQSEIEYLETMLEGNEEAKYSFHLIKQSLASTHETISKANNTFRKVVLDLKPVVISEFLFDELRSNAMLLKGITIKTNIDDNLVRSYVDVYYMNEVVANILHNAVDAMNESQIADKTITVFSKTLENWIYIGITDNGSGIPDELVESIFLPFSSTKNPLHNWGVGLSYCHRIVTAHDGKINVTSDPGKGTTFEIMLPMIQS